MLGCRIPIADLEVPLKKATPDVRTPLYKAGA